MSEADGAFVLDWMRRFATAVERDLDELTALDQAVGDGDHGTNLHRGLTAVLEALAGREHLSAADALRAAGAALVSTVGGASGPLYGTMLQRAGDALAEHPVDAPTAQAIATALSAGVNGVSARGHAQLGDKTMLDVLLPAVDEFARAVDAGASSGEAARRAAGAALDARAACADLQARRGRASYLGARSIGHVDPGAASATLLMTALHDALASEPSVTSRAAARGARGVAAAQTPAPASPLPATATVARRAARVGLVLVSHSRALAEAAMMLALDMITGDPPRIALAAGRADGGTGTDATRVAAAISEANEGAGVIVLTDLGSAVLASDMALELLGGRIEVRVVAAPFVEGLLAAIVRAASGDDLETVAGEAAASLAPKIALLEPGRGASGASPDDHAPRDTGEESIAAPPPAFGIVTVRNEGGLHARPASEIAQLASTFHSAVSLAVDGKPPAPAASTLSISILAVAPGTIVRVSAVGPDAEEAVAAVIALIEGGFGEALVGSDGPPASVLVPAEPAQREALGVSPGRVIGPAAVLVHSLEEPSTTAVLAPPARGAAARILVDAMSATADSYRRRADKVDGHRRDVLTATAAIAEDPVLIETATLAIRERGLTPERGIWEAIGRMATEYRAAGGELLDRITDLVDVRDRTIARLTGVEPPGLPERDHPYVLIADDLAPADTVLLDPSMCLALVTEQGGPTAHTAIIARELGLPAIVGAAGATTITDGTLVLVDGTTGELIVQPDETLQATATGVITVAPFTGQGRTSDGHRVVLNANVGAPREVARAVERGAEGVGLFRTEFCFLDRTDEPSVDEQVEAYRQIFAAFPGERVVVRTLDAGSDKPLPFLSVVEEPNPALGLRGVRTSIRDPQVLERQLDAIARAASLESAEVAVMAPMIATLHETREFAQRARAAGISSVGIMLETPAAAMTAAELCAEIDFVSVGTNDLSQYTMAADRMSGSLASLADHWQPALLRMIRLVGEAAEAAGTPMGLCGEAAANPDFAPVLVGLGATSLSMVSRAIPTVGATLAGVTLAQCRDAAAAACAAADPAAARVAARAVLA